MLMMTICNSILLNSPTVIFFVTFINDTEMIIINLQVHKCRREECVVIDSSAVIPVTDSLKHCSDVAVKWSITCALERLSNDPYNCFLIHQHDALKVNCIHKMMQCAHCNRWHRARLHLLWFMFEGTLQLN